MMERTCEDFVIDGNVFEDVFTGAGNAQYDVRKNI